MSLDKLKVTINTFQGLSMNFSSLFEGNSNMAMHKEDNEHKEWLINTTNNKIRKKMNSQRELGSLKFC